MNVAKIHRKLMITESQFYFANISTTKARIFMKFYVVVNFYLVSLSFKFHTDLCIDACTNVGNTRAHVLSRVCAFMTRARTFVLATSRWLHDNETSSISNNFNSELHRGMGKMRGGNYISRRFHGISMNSRSEQGESENRGLEWNAYRRNIII